MAKFCKHCGKPRNVNARFCRYCGAAFNVPAQPQTQQYNEQAQYVDQSGYRQQAASYMQQPYGQAMPVKQKDPYKPLKVLLVITCLALVTGGILTIPDKISAARNGAVSGDESLIIENSGRLKDEQKIKYAHIDALPYEEGAADYESEAYVHDDYAWYSGDGSGWLGENEKEGSQE